MVEDLTFKIEKIVKYKKLTLCLAYTEQFQGLRLAMLFATEMFF